MSISIVSNNTVKNVNLVTAKNSGAPVYHWADSNKKYVATPECKFFIWSLLAVVTCPNRTRMCGGYLKGETPEEGKKACEELGIPCGKCYALKAEQAYPSVIPSRKDNTLASLGKSFVNDMTAIILKTAKGMKKPKLIVRIHESGDFYSKEYAMKWIEIAKNCLTDSRIEFWTYSKSFEFFDGVELPANFRFIASVWADTKPSDLEIIRRNGWRTYSAVDKFTVEPEGNRCHCENCGRCGMCGNQSIPWIKVQIH